MPDHFNETNPKISDSRFQNSAEPTRDHFMMWNKVVAAYSECLLTKESDKLVAISGVAKDLVSLGGPRDYVAGLWKDHLIFDLLWYCPALDFDPNAFIVGTRALQYRVPT
jgi:hypothetical protein